jgi:NAD(P)-dependent dehydrogenase (short-subunit alcohol dehydrogenase family)
MEAKPLDKWILVTGANDGGLGEAASVAFLARGFNVIAASFDDEPLSFAKPLKGSTDGFLVRFGLDTTSARSIEAAVQHVQQLTDGKLDLLISMTSNRSVSRNHGCMWFFDKTFDLDIDFLFHHTDLAGCGYYMPLIDAHIKDARNQFDVNVWGTLAVTQAFFPMLRAAKGIIINHVTIAGVSGLTDPVSKFPMIDRTNRNIDSGISSSQAYTPAHKQHSAVSAIQ